MVLMVVQGWMRILIQKISDKVLKPGKKYFSKGFSFMEILLVLTILILLIGTILPNFFVFFSKPHESEFKHLSSLIKILRNDAILKSMSYCIKFDIQNQQIINYEKDKSGKCKTEHLTRPKVLKPHVFPEELILRDAKYSEENPKSYGNSNNLLEIYIDSSGFVTPFSVIFSLKDFSKSWIIESESIMGNLQIKEF